MDRIFATKVWGLGSETWGALGFSKEGVRDSLAGEIKPGDFVLYIGTMAPPTAQTEQGRLLGLTKVDSTHISTADLVEPTVWAQHLQENGGQPKWPFGLPVTEVWRFTDNPLPDERVVLPRLRDGLSMKLATNYEQLKPDEVARVLSFPREKVENIYRSAAISTAQARQAIRAELRSAGARDRHGPTPVLGKREAVFSVKIAFAYCMELVSDVEPSLALPAAGLRNSVGERRRVYKIGWSTDVDNRKRALNFAFPAPEILGWRLAWKQEYASQLEAFRLEQAVLARLTSKRLARRQEIVVCTPDELQSAFISSMASQPPPTDAERSAFVLDWVANTGSDSE